MSSLLQPNDKIPTVGLSHEIIPQHHQFEAWQQACIPMFDAIPLKASDTYSCSCTCYLVDELVFTHTRFDKMGFVRSSKQLSGGESDCISLQYYQSGRIQGVLEDGTPLLMQPDRISIQDFALPYNGIGETTNNFGVVIPRHLISAQGDIFQHHPMFSWSLDSLQGRLLKSVLSNIWQELPNLKQSESALVVSTLLGVLNGLLPNRWDDEVRCSTRQASLTAMQDFIRANLQHPDLKVEHLCKTFHCSRATIYRLFQPLGGFKSYLYNQRLKSGFRDLQNKPQQKVSTVAHRWGFPNAAHFTRRFKQQYGIAPSELREMGQINQDSPDPHKSHLSEDVYIVRNWLECRT
ncbi:MAG: helix-turn-helix transcriptional regulator [Cyanobacteria bacterium P01_E01_bin.34]